MKRALIALVAGTIVSGVSAFAASSAPAMRLWRLDCGTVAANNLDIFSDTHAYAGKSKRLAASCYLIRHGDDYMIWDTGLAAALKGKPIDPTAPMSPTLTRTITEQLTQIGVEPAQIGRVGISHYHGDHIGQARDFPAATLMIGAGDWAALSARQPAANIDADAVANWVSGGGKVEPVTGDRDVFGDGTVRMIDLPGHTPGHHALLVRLPGKGPVLLTGDVTHFHENYDSDGIPSFNTNRADSLASLARFKALAKNLAATVVIQHDPADIAKLPLFPDAAE
jgi:glyoxylase-like metal-dependent hydrolase (beta-lactamase superfamily II)